MYLALTSMLLKPSEKFSSNLYSVIKPKSDLQEENLFAYTVPQFFVQLQKWSSYLYSGLKKKFRPLSAHKVTWITPTRLKTNRKQLVFVHCERNECVEIFDKQCLNVVNKSGANGLLSSASAPILFSLYEVNI